MRATEMVRLVEVWPLNVTGLAENAADVRPGSPLTLNVAVPLGPLRANESAFALDRATVMAGCAGASVKSLTGTAVFVGAFVGAAVGGAGGVLVGGACVGATVGVLVGGTDGGVDVAGGCGVFVGGMAGGVAVALGCVPGAPAGVITTPW